MIASRSIAYAMAFLTRRSSKGFILLFMWSLYAEAAPKDSTITPGPLTWSTARCSRSMSMTSSSPALKASIRLLEFGKKWKTIFSILGIPRK